MRAPEPFVRRFIDTNIWLYALVEGREPLKHECAKEIVQSSGIVVSVQIVNETSVNLLKKADFTEAQIQRLIAAFYTKYEVVPTERDVLLGASLLRRQYSFSYWDSLVVSSALEAHCTVLYSEDMQAGLRVEGQLTIINPFRGVP